MNFNEIQWFPMILEWISIDFNGFQLMSMNFNEMRWIPMNFNGFHWVPGKAPAYKGGGALG